MGSISMSECMQCHLFYNTCVFYCLRYGPLCTTLRVRLAIIAFKQIRSWLLCIYIRLNASSKHNAHRQATVFTALALAHMYHASFGIYIGNGECSYFGTA